MKRIVEYIARALVDRPDQVRVRSLESGGVTRIELEVAPEDVGKVIGKAGRTAKAMRSLVSASAAREHKKVHLEIRG